MSSRLRSRSPSPQRNISLTPDGRGWAMSENGPVQFIIKHLNNIGYKNVLLERLDQAQQFCAELWERINIHGIYYEKERLLNNMNAHLAGMYFYINRTIIPVKFQHDKTIEGYLILISQEVNLLTNAALSGEFLAEGILNLSTNECKEYLKKIDDYIQNN